MSPRKKVVADPATLSASTAAIAFAEAQVAAKPEPDPVVSRVLVPAVPCALEGAPIGAKCIVSRTDEGKAVRLLTPQGVTELGKDDLFYTLPAGAKVRKVSDTHFEAFRLGLQGTPIFTCHSARDAVTLFLQKVA